MLQKHFPQKLNSIPHPLERNGEEKERGRPIIHPSMANSQLIDHEAATREIAKGLELTTRLHSLLRGAGAGGSAKSAGQLQMESLSQEIMQVLVAALSLLMPKPVAVPRPTPAAASAAVVVERPISSTTTTTTSARARAPVALDITLACPGREEIKISSSEEVVEISAAAAEEKAHKQDRKRTHLQSGTMISYEHSSDDHQWKLNDNEKKINKTKLPRNNQYSSTITTTSPFNDGHQWRKYGEKKICNSTMPRCYYRCTYKDDQGCPATKQVQQTESKDPPTYVVTYKQQHSCKNRALPISSKQLVVVDPPPVDLCHLRL